MYSNIKNNKLYLPNTKYVNAVIEQTSCQKLIVKQLLAIACREGSLQALGYIAYCLGTSPSLDLLIANRSLEAEGKHISQLAKK